MRCLVTGGCGFIGSHLVEDLIGDGHEVTVYDDLSSGCESNLAAVRGRVRLIRGDIRDGSNLAGCLAGIECVFHEAALVSVFESVRRPMENHEINITGTLNVLEGARAAGVRRVILASSAAVYGNDPSLPKREDMRPSPESPYAVAKLAGEHYLRVFATLHGMETVSLRYFNVYGPRQDPRSMYAGVIARFMESAAGGGTPVVYGDGGQTRDFVYVRDVVRANRLAMSSVSVGRGEAINIGTGRPTSLLELLGTVGRIYGLELRPEFRDARAGDVRDSLADIGRAAALLGYSPSFTLAEGLTDMLRGGG